MTGFVVQGHMYVYIYIYMYMYVFWGEFLNIAGSSQSVS